MDGLRTCARQAVEAGKPCDVILGTIASVSPMRVQIDQKTSLTGAQLIVPQYLTDHTEKMSIPGLGSVSVLIENALKTGDQVILLQKRGAQQYLIVDRY